MAKISDLSDELLVKILSFLPTKEAVSTSILSKQWKFLWMWCPNLDFDCSNGLVTSFINENLPLLRAPIINSLRLSNLNEALEAETKNFESWVEIAVSRGVHELICNSYDLFYEPWQIGSLVLPSSLYTCSALVTLKLGAKMIFVDVPQTVWLPSLKTLHLYGVTYSNNDSLQRLLCSCPVVEDLFIDQAWDNDNDNEKALVIKIPSLQRLTLSIDEECSSDESVIITPSLKYFNVGDLRTHISYSIEHMPELEEAEIFVMEIEKLLKSVTTVKRLSVYIDFKSGDEFVYGGGIVFNQLENLKFYIWSKNWSKMVVQLLKDSPNLQNLDLVIYDGGFREYRPISWNNNESSVPKCLLKSLKTFKFKGSTGREEEREFLSYIFRHARCLESTSVLRTTKT